jgi:succinate-acetate transporter protein
VTPRSEDLETPDFDGRQFVAGEPEDEWPSRSHGWALLVAGIFAFVGFGSLRQGSVLGATVFLSLAVGVFFLAAVAIRHELRRFMRYRHRL